MAFMSSVGRVTTTSWVLYLLPLDEPAHMITIVTNHVPLLFRCVERGGRRASRYSIRTYTA